jgi:probable F420-dependent oxidoreductase
MQKRHALSIPFEDFTLLELPGVLREAERLGYTDAWAGELDGCDIFTPLATAALTTGLRVGTSIVNVFTRGPATLASSATGLSELAPGRFVLGIGAGSVVIVERWNGGSYLKPVTRVREMAQVLRAALDGEKVTFHGETVQVDGFRLSRPPRERVPIHIAGLRPGMLRVAGAYGEGVILNWLAPADVPRAVGIAREAAVAAGRDPDALEVGARLFVSTDPPGEAAEAVMRRWTTAYLNVPTYRAFQEWLGRGADLQEMWAAWAAGDRKAALAAIPGGVLRDYFIGGTVEEKRAQLQRYFNAGIDTAYLHFMSSETDRAVRRRQLQETIAALSPVAMGG